MLLAQRVSSKILQTCRARLYSTRIADILENKKTDINATVKGWVKLTRKMKSRTFIDINDGSTFKILQIVIPNDIVPEKLGNGASVEATGVLKMHKNGQIELHPESIRLLGDCDFQDGFPFSPKLKYDQDELREFLHFRIRKSMFASVLRIRSCAHYSIHNYFQRENYINVSAPILSSNDCEGGGEIFQVVPEDESLIKQMKKEDKTEKEAFFDRNVYLTVSSQLHLETAARALSNVYHFGPTFRAENSKSRLHLSEFYMLEAEIAFLDDIQQLLQIIENLIKTVTKNVLDSCEEEILNYRKSIDAQNDDIFDQIIKRPYRVMDFDEAYSILQANSDQLNQPIRENKHLSKEHELFLVKYCDAPVFIVKWPRDKKPFYVKTSEDESYVDAVDLLFPDVGEVCGGSLREHRYDVLKENLIKNDLMNKLDWYLDLRKFGNVPTGGYGLGFERYMKVLLGVPSIKDVIPFPRWPHNCKL